MWRDPRASPRGASASLCGPAVIMQALPTHVIADGSPQNMYRLRAPYGSNRCARASLLAAALLVSFIPLSARLGPRFPLSFLIAHIECRCWLACAALLDVGKQPPRLCDLRKAWLCRNWCWYGPTCLHPTCGHCLGIIGP